MTSAGTWSGRAIELLASLVETLTADRWEISVRSGAQPLPHQSRSHYDIPIGEVALFSGGLDSTAYVAERSLVPAGDLLLVSYFEPKWKAPQDDVFGAIDRSRRRGLPRFTATQQVRAGRPGLEKSARTRGLLYAATAVFFAAVHRVARVAVPENGQLALNPALTPARVAACSTRSVHPFTLGLLNEVIREVGGAVEVVNPYLYLTKGEVCRRALGAGLTPTTLTQQTVSCGHASSSRPKLHCGHCYPCLMRHSGLLAALGDDDTPYSQRVWDLPDHDRKTEDRRALHRWLERRFQVRDLVTDMPVPAGIDLAPLVAVVNRGRAELSAMFDSHRETGRERG
ncbi:7-cyano-7-deazaguanine synthase [Micromonospora radicis]|uniref:7-cyano-7-deazaguanine synthase n=1 Tax=Micromonospora radicis TaxID=1894971 RepID=A0A418MUU4_9ACTN|nr:7-cyano-7-deazaguanine synthase [Micromonospora radicis]RIV38021.1 hypothetical protein D2L64_13850 [Micromonospora radicis]